MQQNALLSGTSVGFEGRRDDYFPDLMSWAQEHGASCEGFTVTNFGAEGYGLRATRDIKVRSSRSCYVNIFDSSDAEKPVKTQLTHTS